MELAAFLIFAAAALVSAVIVVAHRNPVYSTLSLVVTLLATAALFVLLGSPFLAALQVLLYTGAILVLFLFVIMLLNVQRERTAHARTSLQTWGALVAAFVMAGAVGRLLWDAHAASEAPPLDERFVALSGAAELLFSTYLLPFEMIGLLLLIAVVVASWVAKRDEESGDAGGAEAEKAGEGGR
jgi:NADH-quinone oxidoreductase subunit J